MQQLLDELEKTAGQTKEASDSKSTPTEKPAISAELESLLTKSASTTEDAKKAGEDLAKQLLEKVAKEQEKKAETKEVPADDQSVQITNEEDMNKQAEDFATLIAKKLMEKLADTPTAPNPNPYGVPPSHVAVPNKINEDNAAMVAQHEKRVGPTPGTDGEHEGGEVNDILDGIVSKALSMGAVSYDQAAANKGNQSSVNADGVDPAIAEANAEVQKTAAVMALVEAGVDFATAADLVKEAAAEIEMEEFGQMKLAALNDLVAKGISFDEAITLVKEASEGKLPEVK